MFLIKLILFPPGMSFPSISFSNHNFEPSLDLSFSQIELEAACRTPKIKSSPGLDGIDYRIIRAFPDNAKEILLTIFNRIFVSHSFPNEWKRFLVFSIPKQGENLNFRPISLASCLCKILERMIANRVSWFFEHHNLSLGSQFGFRRGRGCTDNLAILHTNIQLGFESNSSILASFLDIKAAYDNVVPTILLQRLVNLGIFPNILAFIYSSTAERQVHCKFEKIDEIRWAFKGLPQGSILSQLLYNIYVAELEKCCLPECNITQRGWYRAISYLSQFTPWKIYFEKLLRTLLTLCRY